MATGNILKEQLKERNWTAAKLAELSGIPATTIRSIITKNTTPNADTLYAIAAVFGCPIDALIDKEAFDASHKELKRAVVKSVFDGAMNRVDQVQAVCNAAGFEWTWSDDGLIHIVDKKTQIEYAVENEAFNEVANNSIEYTHYNFNRLIKSAKVINNGNEENKG